MAPGTVWTSQEDEELRQLVEEHGEKKWTHISSLMGTRKSSKQCRRRWLNHLNMKTKKCGWAPEEDQLLLNYHQRMGNKWTEIAKMIGGRTDNAVKNRYHALVRRDGRGGTLDCEDGRSQQEVVHPAHVEDTRSLDMWKSSLEKLRSWIGRRKRQCLEDAVASAIRAVDKDSDVDEMETDPSPYLDISKAADIQPQGWPDMSNSVECHVDLQSSSESQRSQDRNDQCHLDGQMNLVATSLEDSSSAELVNEMMEIESGYNPDIKMENSYGAPYSEHSSKSSSSERFAHPDGFRMDTCYSQQAVQGELQLWVMQEEHPHPALYSPGVPSASLDEYYPELSMGIQSGSAWHEIDVDDSYSKCTPLSGTATDAITFSPYIQSEQSQSSCF